MFKYLSYTHTHKKRIHHQQIHSKGDTKGHIYFRQKVNDYRWHLEGGKKSNEIINVLMEKNDMTIDRLYKTIIMSLIFKY